MSVSDAIAALVSATAGGRPRGRLERLHTETIVAAPLETTFAFFADAANLERLTPSWVNFRIRSGLPIEMRAGALIDYQIVLHGLPMRWRSRIDVWEPGRRFVDTQIIGPYRWWRHEHRFECAPQGTRVLDDVEFLPRMRHLTGWYVRRDVGRIFAYRQATLRRLFEKAS